MITRLDHHRDQRGWDILADATGAVAWDVGANIGQSTRVLANGFDRILAFEPCRESYAVLADEMPANVECLNIAVSDRNGSVRLAEMSRSIATGQLTSGEGLSWGEYLRARTVPCRTLDSFIEHNLMPDFLKIDTENHEVEVVRGARRLLSEVRPIVHIEVHKAENEKVLRGLLSEYSLVKLTHGDYLPPHSYTRLNHFWLVDERAVV